MTSGYLYDQSWSEERERLAGIEAMWDPGSRALLDRHGARAGASVLEAGAGGGALVQWLAERVGPRGRVLAVDIDVRFIEPLASDTVEVRRADVVADDLPQGEFDLVHARLLLEHLPQREHALDRLLGALRPGGRIVIEDYDWTSFGFEAADAVDEEGVQGIIELMARAGFDRQYGRRLTSALADRGLDDVAGEGRLLVIDANHPGADFFRLSFEQLAPAAVSAGTMSEDTARILGERLAAQDRRVITPVLVAASGVRR